MQTLYGKLEEDEIANVCELNAVPMISTKSILLADDSRSIRQLVSCHLRDAGYEVIEAENGQHGIELAKGKKLDLVLTDLNMPVLDGYGLTRGIRTLPEHRTTPILFVTTESKPERKAMGKEAGANGWITKPVEPSRLLEVVAHVLEQTEGATDGN